MTNKSERPVGTALTEEEWLEGIRELDRLTQEILRNCRPITTQVKKLEDI